MFASWAWLGPGSGQLWSPLGCPRVPDQGGRTKPSGRIHSSPRNSWQKEEQTGHRGRRDMGRGDRRDRRQTWRTRAGAAGGGEVVQVGRLELGAPRQTMERAGGGSQRGEVSGDRWTDRHEGGGRSDG